jgi:hypothetical protein
MKVTKWKSQFQKNLNFWISKQTHKDRLTSIEAENKRQAFVHILMIERGTSLEIEKTYSWHVPACLVKMHVIKRYNPQMNVKTS